MKTITIIPLSTPKTLTAASIEALNSAKRLYLATKLSPCSAPVLESGRSFCDMDDLYESAADFDALNEAVANRLCSGASCAYAVPGDGCFAQFEAIRRLADERGFELKVLPGVSFIKAAFPETQCGTSCTARELPRAWDRDKPLLIQELDSVFMAGEVKLKLSRVYPDNHGVVLASMRRDGVYIRKHLELYELDRGSGFAATTVLLVPPLPFERRESYDYADLTYVMGRLRAPGGCPWDREQSHESLMRALTEECCELLDAIDEKDDAHMCEELGDVLLQVVFHAEIAAEGGRFDERDVTDGIVKKLIHRHPHIFGDVTVSGSDEVLVNWDKLKAEEQKPVSVTETLKGVPKHMSALIRAQKVQKRAGKARFDWSCAAEAFPKVYEEAEELSKAMRGEHGEAADEAGDLLFAVVNVIRLLGLDSEDCANAATDKFICRFERMEALMRSEGKSMKNMSLDEMNAYWDRVKLQEGHN